MTIEMETRAEQTEHGGALLRSQHMALDHHWREQAEGQTAGHRGGAAVIALHTSAGEHDVGAFLEGARQQVFQLADLVSRECGTSQVIALDMKIDTELTAQSLQVIDRRGKPGELDAWKIREG